MQPSNHWLKRSVSLLRMQAPCMIDESTRETPMFAWRVFTACRRYRCDLVGGYIYTSEIRYSRMMSRHSCHSEASVTGKFQALCINARTLPARRFFCCLGDWECTVWECTAWRVGDVAVVGGAFGAPCRASLLPCVNTSHTPKRNEYDTTTLHFLRGISVMLYVPVSL